MTCKKKDKMDKRERRGHVKRKGEDKQDERTGTEE